MTALAPQVIAIVAFALFLLGCLFMHLRLRTRASFLQISSLAVLTAWYPLRAWLLSHYASVASGAEPGQMLAALYQFQAAAGDIAESALLLVFCVAFFTSARSIMGPNNSFKPSPLRGPA